MTYPQDDLRKIETRLHEVQAELHSKINELRMSETKVLELEANKRELDYRANSLEQQLRQAAQFDRQKEAKVNMYEQSSVAMTSEMNMMKLSLSQKDDELHRLLQQVTYKNNLTELGGKTILTR